MNEVIKAKREELKALSQGFQILVKEGAIDSVNTGLVQIYANQGHTTLNSFNRWKEQGFKVKKGSKALLLWGEPKPFKKSGETPTPTATKEDKEETFFPLAYVFSNLQVEPLETANMKR